MTDANRPRTQRPNAVHESARTAVRQLCNPSSVGARLLASGMFAELIPPSTPQITEARRNMMRKGVALAMRDAQRLIKKHTRVKNPPNAAIPQLNAQRLVLSLAVPVHPR